MSKAHSRTEFEQAGLGGGCSRFWRDSEELRGAPHQSGITGGLGGGQQRKALGVGRKVGEPPLKALLDPIRQGRHGRQGEATGELGRRHRLGQFQEGKRIAPRLGDDSVEYGLVEWRGQYGGEQRPCLVGAQPAHMELG